MQEQEMISIVIDRGAQAISQKRINNFGVHTHPKELVSERYKKWCEYSSHEDIEHKIGIFLNEQAITSLAQLPAALQDLLEWAGYEGYEFQLNELIAKLDSTALLEIYGEEIRKGIISKESKYYEIRTNLGDQLVAEVIQERKAKAELDIHNVLKTIDLVKDIYFQKSENVKLNIRKHYEKPVVLDICLFDLLKCQTEPNATQQEEVSKEEGKTEEECRCKDKPIHDPCDCKCKDECVDPNPCCAEISPYIGELFVVKDEAVCYEPGDISYIENVMKSEIRERTHRHLQREETYSETEEETSTFEERDLQVEKSSTLHTEIDKIVEQDIGVNAGAQYANKKPGMRFSAYLNASYKQARKDAKRIVQDESKRVISQAISRVEKKIKKVNSVRLLNEIEETNRHVFGGENGAPEDISRQIFSVTQLRKAQVYSYGYRMMIDINLPEPAALYKKLLEDGFEMRKPEKPCINIGNISTEKYLEYVQCYGFTDLAVPMKETQYVYFTVKGRHEIGEKDNAGLHKGEVQFVIPDDYQATSMSFASKSFTWDDNGGVSILVQVGNGEIYIRDGSSDRNSDALDYLEGNQTVDFQAWDALVYNLNVKVKCELKSEILLKWKIEVFNRIMAQYEENLQAYENAKAAFERNKQNQFSQHPFLLKSKIVEHLKHQAITYISCQFFAENDAMKNKVKPCGFPQMDIQEAKKEGDFVRFFELAFEWPFMNYILYQFSYGKMCKWAEMQQEDTPNGLFTKFLQAGFARVSIPVREGYENHVSSYLVNRQISPYNIPSIPQNMVPIHEEIREMKQNFNTDREGYVILDSTVTAPVLAPNQVFLRDNLDYFVSSVFDQIEADKDKDREIFINCNRYRIMSISYDAASGEVILNLDRPFEEDKNKAWDWSTGAVFVGAAWKFGVPTKLAWLRKEGGCLPCYPIECNDYSNAEL